MFGELKKEVTLVRVLIILLIIAVGIHLFNILSSVLQNFSDIILILFVAWLVSFILEPVVEKTTKVFRISKVISSLIVYLLLVSLFVIGTILVIPVVISQIQTLIKIFPELLSQAPPFVVRWGENFSSYLNNAVTLIPSVAQFLLSTFIVLIISFYFIVDKEKINKELFSITPVKWHEQIRFIQKTIDTAFASFLRVQLLFGLVAGIITWIVLQILGIELAAAIGVLSGILTIIPFIGPVLAVIPPVFIAFTLDSTRGIIVFIVLFLSQQIIFNVWGPKLMGNAFRLHPLIILVSFFIGFKIAGGMGAIFAVPLLSIIVIVIKNLSHYLLKSDTK